MQNNVPDRIAEQVNARLGESPDKPAKAEDPSAIGQTVDRSLERRRAAAHQEVERLVAATFRVIERSGKLEPRVSEIVREAGLSNQAFYRHFRGKQELLAAVLDEGIRALSDYLAERMDTASDPVEAIREWIRGVAAQARNTGVARASRPFAMARGRLLEALPQAVAQSEARVTAPLQTALEAARETGTMPAIEPQQEAEALYHLMMGWVEARLIEERRPEDVEIEHLENFALAALTRPVASP